MLAGLAFLDHARLALGQAAEAVAAARHAAPPAKAGFAIGFLAGQEVDLLRRVCSLLRDESQEADIRVSSDFSPAIGAATSTSVYRGSSRRRASPTR